MRVGIIRVLVVSLSLLLAHTVLAAPQTGDTWTDPVTGMEFVWVPGATYAMGQTNAEHEYLLRKYGKEAYELDFEEERPLHEVQLSGFWLGKYEVTNAQYRQYQADHDSGDCDGEPLNGDLQPVVRVDWNQAKAFADWLSGKGNGTFRLPTEAEWEYAARAGSSTAYPWGDDPKDACNHANISDDTAKKRWPDWTFVHCKDGYKVSSPVGTFKANRFGIYDMIGNAWEWCLDAYDEKAYEKHAKRDPVILEGNSLRMMRGGSFADSLLSFRSAYRRPNNMEEGDLFLGFRLVRLP